MCGRFTSLLTPELLRVVFNIIDPPALEPRYNIAPTQEVLVVREDFSGKRLGSFMRWGLIPSWSKDEATCARMINARSETVHEKPAFRQAIKTRRCIVPASGFYEWARSGTSKTPHYITLQDGTPFSFAGIWETWQSPDNRQIESVAILTTRANSFMEPIHDRMPVILHRGEHDLWLDKSVNDPRELQRLYQPYPFELLQDRVVGRQVNSPRNDGSELIRPVDDNALAI